MNTFGHVDHIARLTGSVDNKGIEMNFLKAVL